MGENEVSTGAAREGQRQRRQFFFLSCEAHSQGTIFPFSSSYVSNVQTPLAVW